MWGISNPWPCPSRSARAQHRVGALHREPLLLTKESVWRVAAPLRQSLAVLHKKILDLSLGFAAGVMTAASFWSLLAPAIEVSRANFTRDKQHA